jgi:hypothetical protein
VLEETCKIAFAKVAEHDSDLSELSRKQIVALNIKPAALADVGKYLGMLKEKVEHSARTAARCRCRRRFSSMCS